ncbi:MAG TPA: hypothetical protein VMB21_14125 [Candidatus Limnocylindria bacterium]|nr:hypothetical protein [Candidatus Limnocylindria bacterium]
MTHRSLPLITVALLVFSTALAEPAERNAPAAVAPADARQEHLLAHLPAGLNATGIDWSSTNTAAKFGFRLTVTTDLPRYQRLSFFPTNSEAGVAELRDALIEAKKPVEYLKPTYPAGAELTIVGAFVRCLDGKFSLPVWGPELALAESDSGLPKEDSDYARQLRAKISETKRTQVMTDANVFIQTLGTVSGHVATLTGNREAARVSEIAHRISGDSGTNSPAANGANTPTNPSVIEAAALPADVGRGVQQGAGLARGLSNLFRK